MQVFLDAEYEYHWTPLIGCLAGQLRWLQAPQPSATIGAVTGALYLPPSDTSLPAELPRRLLALGVRASVLDLRDPSRVQRWWLRHQARRELQRGRAVTAFGFGESAFGREYGLIVGCDDERRAWRRNGPMTEQVSPWLSEEAVRQLDRLTLILLRRGRTSDPAQAATIAAEALRQAQADVVRDFEQRIAVLDSAIELEPQRHAHEVQALAANWGEAAQFWRQQDERALATVAQQVALTLSRYATLFPYPMGGQPNHPAMRDVAARILGEALDALRSV